MQSFIWDAFFFVIALGVLVTIHEFGHFWVARRCGVRVERFSIGFGRKLWSRVANDGTEYVIAMIPLGGYVKMLDERVESVAVELRPFAFNRQPLWQRASIVIAGPLANFILAIFAFWLMFMMGIPGVKPVVGQVSEQSVAYQAGLTANQQIISVNGQKTQDWHALLLALVSHVGESDVHLTAKSADGSIHKYQLNLENWKLPDNNKVDPLSGLGIVPFRPRIQLQVAEVVANSPAFLEGIQVGDKLLAVNHRPLSNWQEFTNLVRHHAGKSMKLSVKRNGQFRTVVIKPKLKQYRGKTIGFLGIAPVVESYPEQYLMTLRYAPIESLVKSAQRTWSMSLLTLDMMGKLITGKISVHNLSGPIAIAKGAGQSAQYGLVYFLGFLALVSINLGIFNLFPLPVLDGGHLLFFAVEAITGRPVSERVQELGMKIGTSVLVVVMMFALFNDLMRL
ncbi:MAG: Regulator of sigma-E protease RseP [Candidatus Celerinatantimonas neptuna]|nr:MAG: Regulator of sigma-E protease RseP [Candidatus Celerinatantimonas neptuna]